MIDMELGDLSKLRKTAVFAAAFRSPANSSTQSR